MPKISMMKITIKPSHGFVLTLEDGREVLIQINKHPNSGAQRQVIITGPRSIDVSRCDESIWDRMIEAKEME